MGPSTLAQASEHRAQDSNPRARTQSPGNKMSEPWPAAVSKLLTASLSGPKPENIDGQAWSHMKREVWGKCNF